MMLPMSPTEDTRRYDMRKIGSGLPSLRPTMSSLVDDDDPTAPVMSGFGMEYEDVTVTYAMEEPKPRPTIPEPAVARARKRRKRSRATTTHKRRKYRFYRLLPSLAALLCDVCVALLFVLVAHAGTPAFVRWIPNARPAPVAELAPKPVEQAPIAAAPPAIATPVAEATPATPVSAPTVSTPPAPTTKAKAAVRSGRAAARVDRRR